MSEPSASSVSYWELLRTRRQFARLWLGQSISNLGDLFSLVALSVAVYLQTDSAAWVAAVFAARAIGTLAVTPVAGRLADTMDRRRWMIALDLVRMGIVAVIPFGLQAWLPSILIAVFVLQAASALFYPSKLSSIPGLVGQPMVTRANALSGISDRILEIAGYPAGGLLVVAWGVHALFWVDALTFGISAATIFSMSSSAFARVEMLSSKEGRFWRGMKVAWALPRLRYNLVAAIGGAWPLGAALPLLVVLTYRHIVFHEPIGYSLMLTALALGAAIGAAVVGRCGPALRFWGTAVGIVVSGVGFIALGNISFIGTGLLAVFLSGLGNGCFYVANQSEMQDQVPEVVRGRVLSARFAGTQFMVALGAASSGWVATALSVSGAYVLLGLLLAGWGLVLTGTALLRSEVRAPYRGHLDIVGREKSA